MPGLLTSTPALNGSLRGLGFERIVRLLVEVGCTGRITFAEEDHVCDLVFDNGELVAAEFGAEIGLEALDAAILTIRYGHLTFADGLTDVTRNLELAPHEVVAHLARVSSERDDLIDVIGSLAAVPRVVVPVQLGTESSAVALPRGAVLALMAVDGQRSVEEIGQRLGLARAIREVAGLVRAGLVELDAPVARSSRPRQTPTFARRLRSMFVREPAYTARPPQGDRRGSRTAFLAGHRKNGHAPASEALGAELTYSRGDPFARFGALMVRRRWFVVAAWLLLLVVAGGFLAPRANSAVKAGGFIVPGSESALATDILEHDFGTSPNHRVFVVFHSPDRTVDDPAVRNQIVAATDRLGAADGVHSVWTVFNSGDPSLVSADRHTAVALVGLEGDEARVQNVASDLRDRLGDLSLEHYVTGLPAINEDVFRISEDDIHRSEMLASPVILILLLLVLRTVVSSLIPLVLGGCGVVLALAAIYLIALSTETSIFAINVASMIGLGLGIDFSLVVINRMREERATGLHPTAAVIATMQTAGRSIAFSGITVMLSMAVLTALLSHIMLVRSISLAVMLASITALMAGMTLLPALLSILGDRIEWLPVLPRKTAQPSDRRGIWYSLACVIMRRPWLWLAASALVLGALAWPIREIALVGASAGNLPPATESVQGNRLLNTAFSAPRSTPIQIVIQAGRNGVWRPEFLDGLQDLTDAVATDSRVDEVGSLAILARAAGVTEAQFRSLTLDSIAAGEPQRTGVARFVNVNGDNSTSVISVVSKYDQYSPEHQALVRDLRQRIIPSIRQLRNYDVHVGGDAAFFIDLEDAIYGHFILIGGSVALMNFVILMMFFRSIWLPLKAVLMNFATILATNGVLVLIFQHGVGTKFLGFESQGLVGAVTPVILYVVLFGLSTDYEVFILSRVKEYYHKLHNNEEAVAAGLQHTAGVVTAAGLVLVATFGSFASAGVVPIKEIGIGLALGVLLDSTLVRVVMLPATMRLLGNRNWWMPSWLNRILPELHEGPAASVQI